MFRSLSLLLVYVCICSTASGGFWRFQETFVGRSKVEYSEIVQVVFDYCQNQQGIPEADVRRDLLSYYKTWLEPAVVEIRFKSERTSVGKKSLVAAGVVYFAKGELVVQYTDCDRLYEEFPINYVTIEGELYEWRFGEKTGRKLKRYHGDTVELVDYILDVAMLKRFMYTEFRKTPTKWDRSLGDREDILFPRMREEIKDAGLVSVHVAKDPFWLRSLTYRKPAKPKTGEITVTIESPVNLKAIPIELQKLPADVDFEESSATAEWRLRYW